MCHEIKVEHITIFQTMRILKKEMVLSYKYINMRIYLLYLFAWHNLFFIDPEDHFRTTAKNNQTRNKTLTRDTSEIFQA